MKPKRPLFGDATVVGLTGGIASGKSTVAKEFASLGARIIDADKIAREVTAPGTPALSDIVTRFGPGMLQTDGTLDRRKLAQLVFTDALARQDLNAITHHRITKRSGELIAEMAETGDSPIIYEASLIVENGLHVGLPALIVVSAPESSQLERLITRDGFTEAEARARLASQLPLAEKIAVADFVIDNSGTLEDVSRRTKEVWAELQRWKR